jgi:hypothetical protein
MRSRRSHHIEDIAAWANMDLVAKKSTHHDFNPPLGNVREPDARAVVELKLELGLLTLVEGQSGRLRITLGENP